MITEIYLLKTLRLENISNDSVQKILNIDIENVLDIESGNINNKYYQEYIVKINKLFDLNITNNFQK